MQSNSTRSRMRLDRIGLAPMSPAPSQEPSHDLISPSDRSDRQTSWLPPDLGLERVPGLLQPDLEVRYAFRARGSQQLEAAAHFGISSLEVHQLPSADQRGEGWRCGAHRHGQAVEPGLSLPQQRFGLCHVRIHRHIPSPAAGPLPPTFSATIASVLSISDATEVAFCSANRATLVGSMIPASNRSSYWPVAALNPNAPAPSCTLLTTMLPSQPPFCAIWRIGSSSALRTMSTPNFSSPCSVSSSRAGRQRRYATPPPGTMPSSTAARVACSASSTRAFFSFISVSVAAPTLITATPPASLASRSCSFSLS